MFSFLSREQRFLGGYRNVFSGIHLAGSAVCFLDANGIGGDATLETSVDYRREEFNISLDRAKRAVRFKKVCCLRRKE